MTKTRCPQCATVSPLPDGFLGRKVRCKKCNAEFIATSVGPSLTPGARMSQGGEAMSSPKQTACRWYYARDRKKVGPLSLEELRELAGCGELQPADMLLPEGATRWHPASEVPAIFETGATPPLDPPAFPPPGETPARGQSSSVATKSNTAPSSDVITVVARPVAAKRGMRAAGAWAAAVLAFVLPVTGATCFVLLNWASGTAEEAVTVGETYGVIEVGSKSVKYTVFRTLVRPGEDVDFEPVVNDNTNTTLGAALTSSYRFNAKGLEQACSITSEYVQFMRCKHRLPEERIFLVASDDLFGPITQSNLDEEERKRVDARARSQLIEAMHEATGKRLSIVPRKLVGEYQLHSLIPASHRSDGVYLDLGGGGTRGGYVDGGILHKLNGPGVNAVKKGKMTAEKLRQAFRSEVENNPGFGGRKRVYLTGGTFWVAANVLHPDNRAAKVPLTARELRRFAEQIRENPRLLEGLKPPPGLEGAALAEVEKEFNKMRSIFEPPYLVAGCEVLLALVDELELDRKELTFIRNGDFAWVLSYAYEEGRKGSR